MRVSRYNESDKVAWDSFVQQSVNGTFLFMRDYMDYHHERFQDYSLLIWDENDRLVALLPAHQSEEVISSHAGLTYGGFVIHESMKLPVMLDVFYVSLMFLRQHGFRRFVYKIIPHIYHAAPAETDLYALFLCNAALVNRLVLAAVDMTAPIGFQERRIRAINKAKGAGLIVHQS